MRISRHQMFMEIARVASRRSTCKRLNVGAVLVHAGTRNVISIGYNGAPSGWSHCGGTTCDYYSVPRGCTVRHAEENALERACDIDYTPHALYVTHSPCAKCVEILEMNSQWVKEVYFEVPYRNTYHLDRLRDTGTRLFRVTPSGYIEDYWTGEVHEA